MTALRRHLGDYWTFYASAILLFTLVALYFTVPAFQQFSREFWDVIWSEDEERISTFFQQFGIWGPLLIIFTMVLQMFLIIFPTWVPMVVAVIGYGPWMGMLISVTAVFCASTVGYWLGEKLTGAVKGNLLKGEKFERLSDFIGENGFWAVVLFRISPFLSNDAISFVAGIVKMGYRKFIMATLAGIVPLAGAIAYFGKNTDTLEAGLYWIGGGGVLLYGIYLVLKYRRKV